VFQYPRGKIVMTQPVELPLAGKMPFRETTKEQLDLPKVVYRLIDPEQYKGQKVLIVGGGDSALEAALAIADEDGSEVSLSYRSESFSRAKARNRERIAEYAESGRITLYMKSNVKRITETQVELEQDGKAIVIDNDAIIINAGGILPTGFLKKIGIEVETKYGTA